MKHSHYHQMDDISRFRRIIELTGHGASFTVHFFIVNDDIMFHGTLETDAMREQLARLEYMDQIDAEYFNAIMAFGVDVYHDDYHFASVPGSSDILLAIDIRAYRDSRLLDIVVVTLSRVQHEAARIYQTINRAKQTRTGIMFDYHDASKLLWLAPIAIT